jgi:hypothetical protein
MRVEKSTTISNDVTAFTLGIEESLR